MWKKILFLKHTSYFKDILYATKQLEVLDFDIIRFYDPLPWEIN